MVRRPRLAVWTVNPMVRVGRNAEPGAESIVYLEAARNEWEPFQIVVSAVEGSLLNVDVEVSDLTLIGNPLVSISQRENVFLYMEHYIRVSSPSPYSPMLPGEVPDLLIPFRNPYTGEDLQGSVYDASPFNLPVGESQPIWVDVYIPPETLPGVYTGSVTVTAEGCQKVSIPVILRVWPFTLPKTPSQRSSFGVNPYLIAYEYGLSLGQGGEALYRILRRYYDLLIDHRVMPDLPEDVVPMVDVERGSADYEAASYPGLGSAAENLEYYMGERGVNSIQLPIWEDWPYPEALTSQRALAERYIAECMSFYASKGWADRVYAYIVDEPNSASMYQLVREWGKLFDEVEEKYGYHVDLLVTEQPTPDEESWGSLVGYVDIWVPIAAAVWADEEYHGTHAVSRRVQAGGEVWCYTALVQPSKAWLKANNWPSRLEENYPPVWLLDYPPINYRVFSWINQHYGIKGILYWNVAYWREALDVWAEADTVHIGGDTYNGEGCLIYPAHRSTVGYDGPVASMRLKYVREGFEDYDYIEILKSLNREEAEELLRQMVRGMCSWNITPQHLYTTRRKIALAIMNAMENQTHTLQEIQAIIEGRSATVVGSDIRHGPFNNSRRETDLEASEIIASTLTAGNIIADTELSKYSRADGTVEWTVKSQPYSQIIAVGGPLVNQIAYKYNPHSAYPLTVEANGKTRTIGVIIADKQTLRAYINCTAQQLTIEYTNGTRKTIGKTGNTDLIVIETIHDPKAGKTVTIIYGLTRQGTLAACKWLTENLKNLDKILGESKAAVLLWKDNGNGKPEPSEVTILTKT